MRNIVIGTRGSKLALYQANLVKQLLEEAADVSCEVRVIHTKGDKILDVALSKIGDKGLFTKELERALLAGEVDLCVHSTKDMPTKLPEGLAIMGMPARADARDALIAATSGLTLETLPQGARVATGSLRRVAQLLRLRPDIVACEIRGNVDSRVKRVLEGEFDAGILAAAGVKRLQLENAVASYIPTSQLIPAAGQGAIAIEAREADEEVASLLKLITDNDTLCAVAAERAVLAALEGGCQVPMGIHADIAEGDICLRAFVANLDGSRYVGAQATQALAVGKAAAAQRVAAAGEAQVASACDAQAAGDQLAAGEQPAKMAAAQRVATQVIDQLVAGGARNILEEVLEAAK